MKPIRHLFRISTFKGRVRFWVGALIVAMSLLIVLSLSFLVYKIKEDETAVYLQETVELQSRFIDRWKRERLVDVRNLAALYTSFDIQADKARVKTELENLLEAQMEFRSVSFADASGVVRWSIGGAVGTSMANRDYFYQVQSTKKEYISELIEKRNVGESVVVFAVPVMRGEQFQGVVAAEVSLELLIRLIREIQPRSSVDTYILNFEGYLLTGTDSVAATTPVSTATALGRKFDTAVLERALAGRQEKSAYRNLEGVKVFGAFAWTPDRSWILVAEIPHVEVFEPYYTLIKLMFAITLIVLMVSYVIAIGLTSKMEMLIEHLRQGTKHIREGHYGHQIDQSLINSAPAELRELSENFNVMSEKLKSTVVLLEESAVIDHLTEVYNRRFLMNEGNKMQMAAMRAGSPCCILLIDADYFKSINDRYGHLVGDRVLRHIATVLIGCVRTSDVVARYGGEEFVVLAMNCDLQQGQELAERIRAWIENSPYREDSFTIRISVSIGVTQNSRTRKFGTNVLEDMIERADKALYKAKHRGRNRVVAESDELEEADSDPLQAEPGYSRRRGQDRLPASESKEKSKGSKEASDGKEGAAGDGDAPSQGSEASGKPSGDGGDGGD
ncbi:sensor domain-containing diguanylate cyclase [Paenibacillus koleovorans]|uniref:sensor domain-containing diguanylate cyclase n=1 Tax=Paenibacillus koleovorans TaxID=121608 RepID=UPI000FD74B3A|nr:diguanylate cyclase [Paenibacillus koleovorans]